MTARATSLLRDALGFGRRWLRDPTDTTRRGVRRAAAFARAAILFRRCERGECVTALGRVRVVADGAIRIGNGVTFMSGMIPTELVCREGAELVLGGSSHLGYGVSIRAAHSVRIGARCLFGSMVRVRDFDEQRVAPVVICDDVWLAHGVIVEPGITIGEGSVVAAGSVVTRDVPAQSLASGNPATCARLDLLAPASRRREQIGPEPMKPARHGVPDA
jgi:maltose O-acetyltransferase